MRRWDRLLWGIRFVGADGKSMLLGSLWLDREQQGAPYWGEPTRALLFRSREMARKFCSAQHNRYKGREDCCARWRFHPVRVRETVREQQ
jgi:hypothetical protein